MNEDNENQAKLVVFGIITIILLVVILYLYLSPKTETLEQCITRKADEFNFTLKEPTTEIKTSVVGSVTYLIVETGEEPPLMYYSKDGCFVMGFITNRTEFDLNYVAFEPKNITVKNQKVVR